MDFDAWISRPVYAVQVFTARLARRTGLPWSRLRVLPGHRDDAARAVRAATAGMVREARAAGLTRADVRAVWAESCGNPRGVATRVDISAALAKAEVR